MQSVELQSLLLTVTVYHIETHYENSTPQVLTLGYKELRRDCPLATNVFLYGRGTENRTPINRLKAYYFSR
jgi:hypothetical protein